MFFFYIYKYDTEISFVVLMVRTVSYIEIFLSRVKYILALTTDHTRYIGLS